MNDLLRRDIALRKTIARFDNRKFQWGVSDCARLVAVHLRHMKRPIPIAKAGSYKSAIGAKSALKRYGAATLSEALDKHGLERIAPAAALPGDIIMLEGDAEFDALHIRMPNGRTFGFAEGTDLPVIFQPNSFLAAWRV